MRLPFAFTVSTAACERGFSLQNHIKTKLKNSLSPENNLEVIMKLCNGPRFEQFPYPIAVEHWHDVKKQKKRRLADYIFPEKFKSREKTVIFINSSREFHCLVFNTLNSWLNLECWIFLIFCTATVAWLFVTALLYYCNIWWVIWNE